MPPVTRAKKRKGSSLSRQKKLTLFWVAGGGGGLLIGGGILAALWLTGWVDDTARTVEARFFHSTASHGLVVREALVQGRAETPKDDVLRALGIATGDPILALDLEAAQARLEALPWIARASVSRRLPGTVFVRLVERRPIALWQHRGRLAVVDAEGRVLTDVITERFARLPILTGDGALQDAPELLAHLAKHDRLRLRLTAAIRVGSRRWNLRFDNRVEVRLPGSDLEHALLRLARLENDERILSRGLKVVDLRIKDRVTVEPDPGAAPHLLRGGRDT